MVTAFGEILFDVYPKYERLGGAPFNFIYHVSHLTGTGAIISRIGADDHGQQIQRFLQAHTVGNRFIQVDERHPTGTAVIKMSNAGVPKFAITEDVAYDHIEPDHDARECVALGDVFYFGTLAQRSPVSRETLYHYCLAAKTCFVDINLRQHYYSEEILHRSFEYADVIKVNEDELGEIFSTFFAGTYETSLAARLLMKKYSISHMAVTLGDKGSWMYSSSQEKFHKTNAGRVVDTVGAGDGFSAMMCVGLQKGWPIEKINTIASEFSAELCTIEGALPSDDAFYKKYQQLIS